MAEHLERHLADAARQFGWIEGLEVVLGEIAALTVQIGEEVRKGAIRADLMGEANYRNVQGEEVKKLDEWSNTAFCERLGQCRLIGALASEEVDDAIWLDRADGEGQFIVMFDPLDGSSNIDVNVTIGTIFSIYHRSKLSSDSPDLLFKGADQVAAGYAAYGSSNMLVYTARNGVQGFTLDPEAGAYIQTHTDIRCPETGSTYSINEGNRNYWSPQQRELVAWYQDTDKASGRPYSARYIGSLVADIHRTLMKGGIFIYPADSKSPQGKLRYLYEAACMALICEEAGGGATDGVRRILELTPQRLHQRTPLFIGSQPMVEQATAVLSKSLLAEPS